MHRPRIHLQLLWALLLILNALTAARAAGPYNAAGYGSGALTFVPSGSGFGQALSITEDASHLAASQWLRTPPGVLDFPANSPWTIEVRRFVWLGTGDPTYHTLVGHQPSDPYGPGMIVVWNEGHDLVARVFGSSQVRLSSGVDCADGQPHSFALVYDGSVCRFYVDGALRATSAALTYAPDTAVNDDIGAWAGQMKYAWTGTIDEAAVSNVAQYTGASYAQTDGPFAGTRVGLVSLYHMDGNALDSTLGGAVLAGTPSMIANGDGTATLDAGTATGGSGTYTYQWYYRPGGDDDLNTNVVGTGKTLSLTGLTNGVPRRYAVQISDGTQSVTADFVWAVAQVPLVVEFIGDSLTEGAGNDQLVGGGYEPPAPTSAGNYLQALLGGVYRVIVHNHGHGGSQTGEWRTDSTAGLPRNSDGSYPTVAAGALNTLLNDALASINASVASYGASHVLVSACLGTNDPNTGDPAHDAAVTEANLVSLIGALQDTGASIILQDIPWRAGYGNTYNAARNATLDSLVTQFGGPPSVYRGDKGGVIAYQRGHTEFYIGGGNSPHDMQQQQNARGALWAKAIAQAVYRIGAAPRRVNHRHLTPAPSSPGPAKLSDRVQSGIRHGGVKVPPHPARSRGSLWSDPCRSTSGSRS